MDRLTKRVDFIQNYLDGIFSEDLHAKRVKSPGSFSSLVFDGPSGIPAGENV